MWLGTSKCCTSPLAVSECSTALQCSPPNLHICPSIRRCCLSLLGKKLPDTVLPNETWSGGPVLWYVWVQSCGLVRVVDFPYISENNHCHNLSHWCWCRGLLAVVNTNTMYSGRRGSAIDLYKRSVTNFWVDVALIKAFSLKSCLWSQINIFHCFSIDQQPDAFQP